MKNKKNISAACILIALYLIQMTYILYKVFKHFNKEYCFEYKSTLCDCESGK